jgi:hypothetical protein
MASYATADLRVEINRCRGGEDGRVTIEHQRERRRDIESSSLSTLKRRHVGAHPHVRRIPLAPRELRGGGGCMALAPHLHMVVWPRKFQPHLPEKYDGTVNPAEFLQIYSTSILAAGGG